MSAFECEFCGRSGKSLNYYFKCDHIYCDPCLYYSLFKVIAEQSRLSLEYKILYCCPTCRAESLSTIDDFIQDYKQLSKPKKNRMCESCEERELSKYCFNCKAYFCNECIDNKHNLFKKLRNHILTEDIGMKATLNFCNCMKERLISFCCLSCETYQCEVCTLLFHLDHNLKSFAQDFKKTKEFHLKEDIYNKIKTFFNIDEVIGKIDTLSSAPDKFSATAVDTCKLLKKEIENGSKDLVKLYSNLCSNSTTKISNYIEIYKRQLCRLRLQQKAIVKLLGEEKGVHVKLKDMTIGEKYKICNKILKCNKNINSNINNDIASFIKAGNTESKRKMTIVGGRIVFKGELVKNFKEKVTLVNSSKLYHEISPHMLAAFRGNSGHCFIAYINNKDFAIELINISSVTGFKPYLDKDSGTHLIKENEEEKLLSKNNKESARTFVTKKPVINSVRSVIEETGSNKRRNSMTDLKDKRKINIQQDNSIVGKINLESKLRNQQSVKRKGSISIFEQKNLEDRFYTIKAHSDTIYGLRQYKIEKEDFLLSFSEDKTIKLWSCDYLHEVVKIHHEAPVRSACILTHESCKYIIAGSYTKDYPLAIYSFSGSFINQIKLKGYTYHVDSYTSESITYLFISTYQPYLLLIYDFESGEKLFNLPTFSYINSLVVTMFDTPILTFIDRFGKLSQCDLVSGRIIFEGNGYGNYSITKWNEKYYIFCGKGTGFLVVDINDLAIVNEYKNVHNDLVKNICKFQHHIYGEMLISLGQDQRINVMK